MPYRIVWLDSGMCADRGSFSDHDIHRALTRCGRDVDKLLDEEADRLTNAHHYERTTSQAKTFGAGGKNRTEGVCLRQSRIPSLAGGWLLNSSGKRNREDGRHLIEWA